MSVGVVETTRGGPPLRPGSMKVPAAAVPTDVRGVSN